ncbi:MAG: chorismate pyruvate-lyase family protein [Candidatus Manganitrophus sp.]|nr:chorismate pyruvate-lyase family protein [Candidatus Manganitrophus sp.]WDT72536.1 MAG: chorismate pyruvate-lyase family protein [Candidatus Manganitrophus sp.]WDT80006.1 MAG: chorismate pyruvate-lyase family protein [Candidatus Manganitrophus sp.]
MENEWLTMEAFWEGCRRNPIDPVLRLLLTSDGTLIRHLESLFLSSVKVAIQDQREILIDEEHASRIGIPAGEKGIQRKVWLSAGGGGRSLRSPSFPSPD